LFHCTPHPGFGTVVVSQVQVDLATCKTTRSSPPSVTGEPTVRVAKDSQSIVFEGKVVLKIHENHKGFPAGSPGPILFEGTSPDRKWILYAIDPQGSASLAADGLVLKAIPAAGGRSHEVAGGLLYPDYRSWCDFRTLVVIAGGSRMAVDNKRPILVHLPSWQGRNLRPQDYRRAFGSVECAPDGNSVVVQEAPQSTDGSFADAPWSLWRVGLDGTSTRLTSPPRGYADESPHFSPDQSTLYFVRARRGDGRLYALRGGRVVGPLLTFGHQDGYYGHTAWPYTVRR
jgi:WD40-like Beta Propeller Repeat